MAMRSTGEAAAAMFGLTAVRVGYALGVINMLTGLFGFVPNPVVSPDGIFAVNTAHNLVHFATGVAFALGARFGERAAIATMRIIAIAYVLVTILGFAMSGDMLLGFIHVNAADHWLHLGLAAFYLAVGFWMFRAKKAL